ncbi:hypothetical protein XFF6990_320040 [Xanthomonas citri pv. fuscans]|nr:hypothetical protein XFF6990_320040 [Xanthomonas citri pv. fuscans]
MVPRHVSPSGRWRLHHRAEAFRRALQLCIWGGANAILARASSVPPHELALSATHGLAAER